MSLADLVEAPADPLLALIGACRRDPRADKIDLGVGVLRDADGRTPVMRAVKAAERRLVETQDSKSYLGVEGDTAFVVLLQPHIFADTIETARLAGLQTPGGTGALRLAADLLAAGGAQRIWMGGPSWPNHAPIFAAAGLATQVVPVFDAAAQRLDGDRFLAVLDGAARGDAVLLQACCHNPTGIDPDARLWAALADTIARRGLVPLLDLAYQGLGDGMEADAAGARTMLTRAEYGLLAYSCDKNFGMYRDRVGALWVAAPDAARARALGSHLASAARASWSMPPDHGAAVVRTILDDAALTADWRDELDAARARIAGLRMRLSACGRVGDVDFAAVAAGRGMFATLPLAPATIARLQSDHGVYMPRSGRINIAGLSDASIPRLAAAIDAVARVAA